MTKILILLALAFLCFFLAELCEILIQKSEKRYKKISGKDYSRPIFLIFTKIDS
jgi:hypothetical protein